MQGSGHRAAETTKRSKRMKADTLANFSKQNFDLTSEYFCSGGTLLNELVNVMRWDSTTGFATPLKQCLESDGQREARSHANLDCWGWKPVVKSAVAVAARGHKTERQKTNYFARFRNKTCRWLRRLVSDDVSSDFSASLNICNE